MDCEHLYDTSTMRCHLCLKLHPVDHWVVLVFTTIAVSTPIIALVSELL